MAANLGGWTAAHRADTLRAMRVMVIGGTGYLGAPAVPQLIEAGWDVHLLGRTHPAIPGTTFHKADILAGEFGAIDEIRPTHLLHFAWETTPGTYWRSPKNLDWISASLGMIRAFAKAGGKRAVIAGTCAEYRWRNRILSENRTPLLPATPYGQAKASLFQALEKFAPEMGLSFGWGRVFFPIGPREKPGRMFPELLAALIERRQFDLGDGLTTWDFMHVDDVAGAFVALLGSDVQGGVNIGSGVPRTLRSVIEDMADRFDGRDLLNFGARPRSPADPTRLVPQVMRLYEEVKFQPRYSWNETIDDTTSWWRQELKSAGAMLDA